MLWLFFLKVARALSSFRIEYTHGGKKRRGVGTRSACSSFQSEAGNRYPYDVTDALTTTKKDLCVSSTEYWGENCLFTYVGNDMSPLFIGNHRSKNLPVRREEISLFHRTQCILCSERLRLHALNLSAFREQRRPILRWSSLEKRNKAYTSRFSW